MRTAPENDLLRPMNSDLPEELETVGTVTGDPHSEDDVLEEEEFEEVLGYMKTEADCPHCNEAVLFEGDKAGEVVDCDACGAKFKIRELR